MGGYALLARMADKCRSSLHGAAGEYHYNCPLDQMVLGFKGVDAEEVKELLKSGASDDELVAWFAAHGTPKTAAEIEAWSAQIEATRPLDDTRAETADKRAWFTGECTRLGLKPEQTTLVEYLDADDIASFKK